QQLDGGWAWWGNGTSQPYLTAYVVQGLLEARRTGYDVDAATLDRAVRYLEATLAADGIAATQAPLRIARGGSADARSYVLFVLAEAGRADRGRAVVLFNERNNLGIYGRAYLLMTLHTIGNEDQRVKTLIAELMAAAHLTTTEAHWEEAQIDYWTMSSNLRSTALALQALVRTDPANFLVPNAVRYLMNQRQIGWRNTHEKAIAILALAEYIRNSGDLSAGYRYRAVLGSQLLADGAVNPDNLRTLVRHHVDLAQVGSGALPLSIERTVGESGRGRLYYSLRLRSFTPAAQVGALDRGISIARQYVAVDSATLSPTGTLIDTAEVGQIVQVRLTISSEAELRFLTIDDPLPAGLEALDSSLRTSGAAGRNPQLESSDDPWPAWWYLDRSEVRDGRTALFASYLPRGTYTFTYLARAAVPGSFQAAPSRAYQTYAPEVFGRSAGAVFTILAP
ncbi:MAG TPA: alpha-2-macroglobulin, partial [Roseiflexaceae bacterium]|nr:alpha-2-macroglobulin [Roseiflexaceae bacterium]